MRILKTLLLCVACGTPIHVRAEAGVSTTTRPATAMARIAQVWSSSGTSYAETDSLATCHDEKGNVLVLATAKTGNRVDVFDAATGRHVAQFGRAGSDAGEMRRPNGLVTVDFSRISGNSSVAPAKRSEIVFVIERDNHRVQAFAPGAWKSVGVFGETELSKAYGGAVSYAQGGPYLFVTETEVPPGRTVHVFRVVLDGQVVRGERLRGFGDTQGPGAIIKPESIVVDDRFDRVLICDEDPVQKGVKVYTRAGKFTGTIFGKDEVEADPEGIVLVDGPGDGLVILTDQRPAVSVWHIYGRKDFRHLAAFTGEPTVANTDGICVHLQAFGPFREGAFFAVNDDTDVRAYRLGDILRLVSNVGHTPF